ncbi:helix-turn-helix transcriptional regulator [Escherichia albertii]|uniref:S24 family peptidase n=1 Tax=Escherichia albertii TaxID=208962 RepID=UPI0007433E20|nr:S24 family peptidase [Escherichia albertii]
MGFTTEKLISNINYLMAKRGIPNVTELAKQIRIPQPTMHRLLSGENKEPKYPLIKQVADFFRVSVPDLMETSMPKTGEQQHSVPGKPDTLRFRGVPVLGNTQLGHGGYWSEMQYPVGSGDGYIHWPSQDENAYALKCVGDSMMPRIKEGEYVIIEPGHSYTPGDEVLVVTAQGEVMVKVFLFERDGAYHLMPVNENHLPVRLQKDQVVHIQYVAGIAKSSLWMPE